MITDKAGKNSALSQHAADQSSRLPRKRWENSRSAYVIVLTKRSRIEQGTCDGRIPGTKSSKCPPCASNAIVGDRISRPIGRVT